MTKAKAQRPPLIYVDTCVYIDLLAQRTVLHQDTGRPRWESAKLLFGAIDDGRVELATSSLIDAEVGCFSTIRDAPKLTEQLRALLDAESTRYIEVDRNLARQAVCISREFKQHDPQAKQPNPADAVHIAAAIQLKCNYLMTHDNEFHIGRTVKGVAIIRPEVVWPQTLDDMLP